LGWPSPTNTNSPVPTGPENQTGKTWGPPPQRGRRKIAGLSHLNFFVWGVVTRENLPFPVKNPFPPDQKQSYFTPNVEKMECAPPPPPALSPAQIGVVVARGLKRPRPFPGVEIGPPLHRRRPGGDFFYFVPLRGFFSCFFPPSSGFFGPPAQFFRPLGKKRAQ